MIKIPYYETSHFVLSNFSAHKVIFAGIEYPTVEHAFHAQKFDDPELREQIRQSGSPLEAWRLGTSANAHTRTNWSKIKVGILTDIIRHKANQHAEVRDALIASGTQEIVENNPHDSFWGSGADGKGQNTTGKILMKIRDELQNSP